MRRFLNLAAAALVALLPVLAAAQVARGPDGLLVVPPLARVTDATGTLSAADKQALEAKLAAFEAKRGSQMAIVMIDSTQPEPISDYAFRVGDAWKIGRPKVGDGVLIVVAKTDRRIWIAVARALEGAIPDVAARRVISEVITPRFKIGDFAGGLQAGVDAIFLLIQGEGLPPPDHAAGGADALSGLLPMLLPFILVGAAAGALLRRLFGIP
ncbi:MAG TPA: TPM domain-containing protein, partial [Burkholderiaceae bacterium]|nr:TPM domain-containing protein [Burkholderiaceae bacterium]